MTTRTLPLQGKTLKAIYVNGDSEILFVTKEGQQFVMYHPQDCCEDVRIEDICGDLQDLVGCRINLATEETTCDEPPAVGREDDDESYTWTFYKFSTIKGDVDIRWYGTSNGYYCEEATVDELCHTTELDWAETIKEVATAVYTAKATTLGEM